MAEPSLADQSIAALDEALRTRDPLSRMTLIEQALRLRRQALEARDAAEARYAGDGRAVPRTQR